MAFKKFFSQLHRLSAHRSYRRLLIGGAISALGDRIGYIAFLGAVTSQSTDVLAVGGITIAEMLPTVFAAPLVSLVVDRMDKRRLMFLADIVRLIVFLIATIFPVSWVFYSAAFISAGFTVLFEPARTALEVHYIPEGELTQANGIRQSIMSLVMICGPAVGGLLVAAFGFRIAFFINAISFAVSAWMVSDLQFITFDSNRTESAWQEILGGVRAVRQSFNLKFLVIIHATFYLIVGIQFPLIYVFVAQNLHGGPKETGWLFSAIGIGGIVGGAWLASLSKEKDPFDTRTKRGNQAIAALIGLDGIVVMLFAGLHQLLPVAALYMVFGFIGVALNSSLMAAIATHSEEHLRGRVMALFSAMAGPLIVISIVLGTPLAREYGAAMIFYISGGAEVILWLAAAIAATRMKEMHRIVASSIDPDVLLARVEPGSEPAAKM